MSESITVDSLRKFKIEAKKIGVKVNEGIACCPGCGQRNGFTIVGEVKFITCFKCGTRMRPKGPPNDLSRNEKGWEIAPR